MSENLLLDILLESAGAGIDSRTIKPDQIFFALPGNRTDGSRFAIEALEKGACLAVVPSGSIDGDRDRVWSVRDVLETMQELATAYRRHLDVPVMAITGSNGKTTNKNLLAAVLGTRYKVHSTAGNFNNHIGLPLTILNAPPETEFLLLEMGTNHFGEINALCWIAEPDFGSILNIGKTHLEFLHSVDGVLKAKSELADYLADRSGKLFLNREESSIKPLVKHPVEIISFDRNDLPKTDYSVSVNRATPDIILELHSGSGPDRLKVESRLWGDHNVRNLIHAIGVGSYFEIDMESVASALSGYVSRNNRSQIVKWKGFKVYLDAYNANPTSMRYGIRAFRRAHPSSGILVLGEMGELGAGALNEHRAVLELISELEYKDVYLVGEMFNQAGSVDYPQFHYLSDIDELSTQNWPDKSPVFIKGSRSVALERLLDE